MIGGSSLVREIQNHFFPHMPGATNDDDPEAGALMHRLAEMVGDGVPRHEVTPSHMDPL